MDLMLEAEALADKMVEIRRQIHMWPELGMEEYRTGTLVVAVLAEMDVPCRRLAGTGILGVLEGGRPGKTVLLRADMDALPLQDQKDVSYTSRVPHKMHACGHDGHVACLLGAAYLLAKARPFPGIVLLAFQPAEEGPGGAKPMIEEGALEEPHADACFGLHLETDLEVGSVGITYGPSNAATDTFRLVIKGEGGHAAAPHETVDAIVVAAQVITALQTIVSREVDPVDRVVISVGTIQGGYKENIIADEVVITGTLRTLTQETREAMPRAIRRVAQGVAEAMKATCEITFEQGYPPLVNEENMTALVERVALHLLGEERVLRLAVPSMGAEDFSYFLQHIPGCFFKLGGGFRQGVNYPGHHPRFDFHEGALPVGAALMAGIALEFLGWVPD